MTINTTTTARAVKPISFHSPTSVKSIVAISVCELSFGLEFERRDRTKGDGCSAEQVRPIVPLLHRRDDVLVEHRIGRFHDGDLIDGSGRADADLRHGP